MRQPCHPGKVSPTFVILLFVLFALPACVSAQPRDCLPLTPTGTQGGALLPGALMNVRFGGTPAAPLAVDVYPHADASIRPLAVVLRGGTGTVGQRSSYVGQLVELLGDAGYVVATADYRSQSLDDAAEDLTAALRLLTMCHAATIARRPVQDGAGCGRQRHAGRPPGRGAAA